MTKKIIKKMKREEKRIENMLKTRNEIVESILEDSDKLTPAELLSLIPEYDFVISIFGISDKLIHKHEEIEEYNEDEKNEIRELVKIVTDIQDNNFIRLIFDTMLFNCLCEVAGTKLILIELAIYLGINKNEIRC